MKILISESTTLDDMLAAVDQDDLVLFKEGKPVALLSRFDEDDLEWYARERDPAFIESIARARAQIHAGQTVGHDDLKQQLGPG